MLSHSPQVAARVLGWALRYAPSSEGQEALALEISSCRDNVLILGNLASLYILGLIRVCEFHPSALSPDRSHMHVMGTVRNPKGPTPLISRSQSPILWFENAADQLSQTLTPAGSTPDWLRSQVGNTFAGGRAFNDAL